MSFNLIKKIFSIYLLICGVALHLCEGLFLQKKNLTNRNNLFNSLGLKRLIFLIPLTILSFYMIELTIIYGLTLSNVPIYIFLLFCMTIILFNDCAEFDGLEIKSN